MKIVLCSHCLKNWMSVKDGPVCEHCFALLGIKLTEQYRSGP